jgi:hypothetical protein
LWTVGRWGTDVFKDAENGVKVDFLFSRRTDGKATSLKVFNINKPLSRVGEGTGRTALGSSFMEPSECLDEMQDFSTGKEESPSYKLDTLYVS